MTDWPDMRLLREYAEHGTEDAFTLLVGRHLALVYHAAFRQTQSADAAEEVVQTVFTLLGRKATRISTHVLLSGWLFNTTRFVSTRLMRDELRRRRRQAEAASMNTDALSTEPTKPVEGVLSLLDELMARLPNRDREVVLARYFEDRSFAGVAAGAGTSEEAAKKRVLRALEKLRGMFRARGITVGAAALAATLEAARAQALPPGLSVASVSAVALQGASGTAALSTLTRTTLELMKWTKIKIAGATALTLVLGLGAVSEYLHARGPAREPGGSSTDNPAAPSAADALQEKADRLRADNAQLALALTAAQTKKAQLLAASHEAERNAWLSHGELAAKSTLLGTNAYTTIRDYFAGEGKSWRMARELKSAPPEEKAAKELAYEAENLRLFNAEERHGWGSFKVSSPQEAADLGACFLSSDWELSEQQIPGVREALLQCLQDLAQREGRSSFDEGSILKAIGELKEQLQTNQTILTPSQMETLRRK
jgi:RNA polymerase sigma factor (sigma-70 family)